MTMPTQPDDARSRIDGESLLAWSVRIAASRSLAHVWTLLRDTGQDYLGKTSGLLRATDAATIAGVLQVDAVEVDRRLLKPSYPEGFETLDGIRVRSADVVTASRRYSPATLGSSGTHLAIWGLRTLPFCARSMEYLTDRCSRCRTIQRWKRSICVLRCDRCGSGLWMHRADVVEADLRDSLSAIAALVDTGHHEHATVMSLLPDDLKHLDRSAAFELLMTLARIVDPSLPQREPAVVDPQHQRRLAAALAGAWSSVLRWPDALRDAVRPVVRRESTIRLSDAIERTGSRVHLPEVGSALATLVSGGSALPVKKAARMLGVTEGQVAASREEGDLATALVLRRRRLSLHLSASEVERLAEVRRDRIGCHGAGCLLGMPAYAVEELIDAGLLTTHSHPWLSKRFGDRVLTRGGVLALAHRLNANSKVDEGAMVPIGVAMRGFGGGAKPWAETIRKLVGAEWDFSARFDTREGLRISMRPEVARRIWSLPMGAARRTYSKEDALDILNMNAKNGRALDQLRTATLSGYNASIDGVHVLELATKRISIAEMMQRTGLPPRTLQQLLAANLCIRIDEYGWDRIRTMSKLKSLET